MCTYKAIIHAVLTGILTCAASVAGILAVEAYHAGAIRTLLIQNGAVVTEYGINITTGIDIISADRMMLDGSTTTDDVGIYDSMTTEYILALTDENGIAFSRTPAMVLDIAYLSGSDMIVGGFFPDGINVSLCSWCSVHAMALRLLMRAHHGGAGSL